MITKSTTYLIPGFDTYNPIQQGILIAAASVGSDYAGAAKISFHDQVDRLVREFQTNVWDKQGKSIDGSEMSSR